MATRGLVVNRACRGRVRVCLWAHARAGWGFGGGRAGAEGGRGEVPCVVQLSAVVENECCFLDFELLQWESAALMSSRSWFA